MVGWRNYFDLKQAETGAHYVAVMENWRVERIYFLFAERHVGVQERGWTRLRAKTLGLHSDTTFNGPAAAICLFQKHTSKQGEQLKWVSAAEVPKG